MQDLFKKEKYQKIFQSLSFPLSWAVKQLWTE
jgi:hypothetical protein